MIWQGELVIVARFSMNMSNENVLWEFAFTPDSWSFGYDYFFSFFVEDGNLINENDGRCQPAGECMKSGHCWVLFACLSYGREYNVKYRVVGDTRGKHLHSISFR